MKRFTPRHQKFADQVIAGSSYVDAYLAAGFKCKRENVGKSAWRLMQNPKVSDYIQRVQDSMESAWKTEADDLETLRSSVRRLVGEFSQKRDEADKALNDAYGAGNYNQVHNRQGYKEAMTYVWRELSALIDGSVTQPRTEGREG